MARTIDEILAPTRRFIARLEMPHRGANGKGNGRNGHTLPDTAAIVERATSAIGEVASTVRQSAASIAEAAPSLPGTGGGTASSGPRGRGMRSRVSRRGGVAAGALAGGSAAIAAYLLDPRKGGRRRALLRDQARRASRLAAAAADATAHDAANRSRGVLATARAALTNEPVDDVVLVERVRSRLGRASRHPGAIDVQVDDGHVTVSGPVLSEDAAAVRATARATRGVRGFTDDLTVHANAKDVPALQGPGRIPESQHDWAQRNWAPTTRLIATALGGVVMAYGLARRGVRGTAAVGMGAGMVLRGMTNMELARALGVAGGRRAVDLQKAITVRASVSDAFALWSRFAEFPRFMSHVRSVETNPDGTYRWRVAGPAGAPIVFTAEVTKLVPNDTIAWKSVDGEPIRHSGIVRFEEVDGRARITVRMTYNPPAGVLGHAVNAVFGTDPKAALDEDLLRFKSLLENGTTTVDGAEERLDAIAIETPTAGADIDARWSESETQGLMPLDQGLEPPVEPGAPTTPPELTEPVVLEPLSEMTDATEPAPASRGDRADR